MRSYLSCYIAMSYSDIKLGLIKLKVDTDEVTIWIKFLRKSMFEYDL